MNTTATVLADRIRDSAKTGSPAEGRLQTNDRIIARVTDGIYREPWSAFRELISNAYDADARRVTIETDYPFFTQIKISDNGNGMDSNTVADLLTNIGGSSKRTKRGKKIGTVNSQDATKSPAGRKLIGKIGIGLFAVAQLTQHFQIISKRKGSPERVSATVKLNTFREDVLVDQEEAEFDSGTYKVISEFAGDTESHGTTIILMNIKPAVREKLQSKELWSAIDDQINDQSTGLLDTVSKPNFHIGRVNDQGKISLRPILPWSDGDSPEKKFQKLFDATVQLGANSSDRADLSHLDNYLRMLWRLSLGSPVPYIRQHPFSVSGASKLLTYTLSNRAKGSAERIQLGRNQELREALNLRSGNDDPVGAFEVFLDGVALFRPVALTDSILGSASLESPMLFVGKVNTDFGGASEDRSGGRLSFEAYLYWNSKIVPKESIGALIRINGASGTLFDPDFLGYQIAEQNRKKQVTCEIFVIEGLDGALNIDRESYNTSHPHYLFIQKWLHNAFRQFATQHKKLGSEARQKQKEADSRREQTRISVHTEEVWERMRGESATLPPVRVSAIRDVVVPTEVGGSILNWNSTRIRQESLADGKKVEALTLVLEAYGLLDGLDPQRRADLIYDIVSIFKGED